MYAEIESSDGTKFSFSQSPDSYIVGDCYQLSGATFRLMDYKQVVRKNTVFEFALPYVNGADFNLSVTPSTTTTYKVDTPVENLMSFFQ